MDWTEIIITVSSDDIDKAADEIRCIMLASRYKTEKRKYLMR